jgi:hypothetical protein
MPAAAILAGLGVALLVGVPADLAQPLAPVLAGLALVAVAWALRARRAFPLTIAGLLGLGALVQVLLPAPNGLVVRVFDDLAAIQQVVAPPPPPPEQPEDAETLRAMLAAPAEATPIPRPTTPDGFLANALLLAAQEERVLAARALAEALRGAPEPRPDAVLLHAGLMGSGAPGVVEHLADPPEALSASARALLAARLLPGATARRDALAVLHAEAPSALTALFLAEALVAASLPQAPTIATAARIGALLDGLAAAPPPDFLDPAGAARFAEAVAGLEWVRGIATRRPVVLAVAPAPGDVVAPLLVRITPPEPATLVEWASSPGAAWQPVPQRRGGPAPDVVPTLRLERPWRKLTLLVRWTDREGVVSAPVTAVIDPAAALRLAAQRTIALQGAFTLYQPGVVAPPGRLNALGIPGHLRVGLRAVEWHSDADRRVRRHSVALPDDAVLSPEPPRVALDFQVPRGANSLFLVAVLADGTRLPPVEKPIR